MNYKSTHSERPQGRHHQPRPSAGVSFESIGISGVLLRTLLADGIATPTPIQAQAIPVALRGEDVIGIAQTGTGKTLAFVLPIMHRLLAAKSTALILVPTRELAFQIEEVFRIFTRRSPIRTAVVVGGASMYKQMNALRQRPSVILATPGRLIDHLQRRSIDLARVEVLVLDEADRMFDMGFAPQIAQILTHVPAPDKRQTLLFSATMPNSIAQLVSRNMHAPVRVEVAPQGTAAKEVTQEMIIIDKLHKKNALYALLKQTHGRVIIFVRTKHSAAQLSKALRVNHYAAEELHSNRSLSQRRHAVDAIQSGRSRILVATDIAARGVDIEDVELVINFDLPDSPDNYVHRIGRTGRAGKKGKSITLVLNDQGQELRQIQRLLSTDITQVHLDEVPSAQLVSRRGPARGYRPHKGSQRRHQRGYQRGHQQGGQRAYQHGSQRGHQHGNRFGRRP